MGIYVIQLISFEFQSHSSIFHPQYCLALGLELQSHVPALPGFLLALHLGSLQDSSEEEMFCPCCLLQYPIATLFPSATSGN